MKSISTSAWMSAAAIFVASLGLLLSQPRPLNAAPGIVGGLSAAVVLFAFARGTLAAGPVRRIAVLALGAALGCALYSLFCRTDVAFVGLGGIAGSFGTVIGALHDGRSLPRRDAFDRALVAGGAALILAGIVATASALTESPSGPEVLFAMLFAMTPVVAGLVALVAGVVRGRERGRWVSRVVDGQVQGWRLSANESELVLARTPEESGYRDPAGHANGHATGVYPARILGGSRDGPGEGLRWALRGLVAFVLVPAIVVGIPLGLYGAILGARAILGVFILALCGLWLVWSRC
jgi:hypothetical protein